LIKNFAQEGDQRELPLVCLPPGGERGTLTTTTEDYLNNSKIGDFYRANFFKILMKIQ